eukprot:797348-Rhodomonas_salina.2
MALASAGSESLSVMHHVLHACFLPRCDSDALSHVTLPVSAWQGAVACERFLSGAEGGRQEAPAGERRKEGRARGTGEVPQWGGVGIERGGSLR